MTSWTVFTFDPLFAITVTIGLYVLALYWNLRWRWLHPLAVTSGGIVILLLIADIPYERYAEGGDMLSFLLGPATIALAVPLYKRRNYIMRRLLAIVGAITLGSTAGIVSCWLLLALFGGGNELLATLLPKSATAAISYELGVLLGGPGELAAVFTVLTGLIGSMLGPLFLRWCKINNDLPLGIAIGTAAHGIGTSRLLRESEEAGSSSGLAMGITGIIVSLLMIPVYWILTL
jgi:putative effector of murein hydrolase